MPNQDGGFQVQLKKVIPKNVMQVTFFFCLRDKNAKLRFILSATSLGIDVASAPLRRNFKPN